MATLGECCGVDVNWEMLDALIDNSQKQGCSVAELLDEDQTGVASLVSQDKITFYPPE